MLSLLPNEIISKIISYTYSPQSNQLLEDIKSYHVTKALIDRYYYRYWIQIIRQLRTEDRNWLINDIFLFLNDFKPILFYRYSEKFKQTIRQLYMLRQKKNIEDIINSFDRHPVNFQINTFWGLMNPNDRSHFISKFCSNKRYG